jgi:hypothetical protein
MHPLMGEEKARRWFDAATADPAHDFVSSRLLRLEMARTLERDGLPLSLANEVIDHVALMPMREPILRLAESIALEVFDQV